MLSLGQAWAAMDADSTSVLTIVYVAPLDKCMNITGVQTAAPPNMTVTNSVCYCNAGYTLNTATQACVPSCTPGYTLNTSTNNCVPAGGTGRLATTCTKWVKGWGSNSGGDSSSAAYGLYYQVTSCSWMTNNHSLDMQSCTNIGECKYQATGKSYTSVVCVDLPPRLCD